MAKKKFRKSASLKEQAVLRLLKGEDMELVSRQTGFAMHELAQWREKYTLGGRENLKSHPKDPHDAELEPIKQALRRIRGCVGKDTGDGIAIRHDWGPQYIARDFKEELKFFGLRNSPALVHEPQTNGVIERFFKTLKSECLWIENFRDLEHARDVVGRWMETYNTQWLIERNGYRTPREVRQACEDSQSAVA